MALARIQLSLSPILALLIVTAAPSPARAETGTLAVDPAASEVDFTIYASKLFTFKREGQFREFTGQLSFDPANPLQTQVDLTVYTSSVDIHNDEHNQLLKSNAFFDVERFPTMHFTSSSANVKPDGTFAVTGDLTIRGITQRLTIPAKLKLVPETAGPSIASFESTFEIDRTQFGLIGVAKPHGLSVSIAKKVRIHIAVATSLGG
jgi:polyisoprenoid-binding protein YceI